MKNFLRSRASTVSGPNTAFSGPAFASGPASGSPFHPTARSSALTPDGVSGIAGKLFMPLRGADRSNTVSNTNFWGDDEDDGPSAEDPPPTAKPRPVRNVADAAPRARTADTAAGQTTTSSISRQTSSSSRPAYLPLSSGPQSLNPQADTVDIEFDLVLTISKGQCLLHADVDNLPQEQSSPQKTAGGPRFPQSKVPPGVSEISLPALNCKVIYVSDTNILPDVDAEATESSDAKTATSGSQRSDKKPDVKKRHSDTDSIRSKSGTSSNLQKKGKLCAWIVIHKLHDPEMRLSPKFLDYVQQTLDKMNNDLDPVTLLEQEDTANTQSGNWDPIAADTNFPVDVVIAINIETSELIIDCIPYDKISCLIQLPQVHIVFSSTRQPLAQRFVQQRGKEAAPSSSASTSTKSKTDSGSTDSSSMGLIGDANGWIVTVVADNFKLFIFHQFMADARDMSSGRKDAFALTINSVRLNVSRCSTLHFGNPREHQSAAQSPAASIRSGSIPGGKLGSIRYMRRTGETDSNSAAHVFSTSSCERFRFINMSVILDFGECSLKFDIRKLQQIRTLVRYWYREDLVKCIFIGDDATKDAGPLTPDLDADLDEPATTAANNENVKRETSAVDKERPQKSSTILSSTGRSARWESNVVCAANFSSFNVNMQLETFMGNTKFTTEKLVGSSLLRLTSEKDKLVTARVNLGKSEMQSSAGSVGPWFNMTGWTFRFSAEKQSNKRPVHELSLDLQAAELRLNFMSNAILMGRFNKLFLHLKDEWIIVDNPTPQNRCKLIICSSFTWDQAQMLMCQNTIADLIQINARAVTFYKANILNNARGLPTNSPVTRVSPRDATATGGGAAPDNLSVNSVPPHANFQRHWPGIAQQIIRENLSFLPFSIDEHLLTLGGNMELKGRHLACVLFENDIRSPKWLVLTLKEPQLSFTTESQQFQPEAESTLLFVRQDLEVQLGHNMSAKKDRHKDGVMARIAQQNLTKGSCPMGQASVNEWFNYTLKNIADADNAAYAQPGGHFYHQVENIQVATLPKLYIKLRTEQEQVPGPSFDPLVDPRPRVEFSMNAEFYEPIQMAVDLTCLEFVQKLFENYISKVKVSLGASPTEKTTVDDPREYVMQSWSFDPSVRYFTSNVSTTDPPGVAWMLNKLGVKNFQTTLPKWIQRTIMDNLDKIVAESLVYDVQKLSKLQNNLPEVVQK